ncbi:MAG: hypothetical protein ABSG95_08445 [Solirubrobacteraceae bacterium]|jgi:hypothetical protein
MREGVYLHRRLGALVLVAVLVVAAAVLGPSLGRSGRSGAHFVSTAAHALGQVSTPDPPRSVPARPVPPLVVSLPAHTTADWTTVARVHGQPAAWLAQRSGVTLMRFDQRLLHLNLHAGSSDGGVAGWTYGDQITPREIHLVVAAFNGGFKLSYPNVGFSSGGHVAVPLKSGLASIVTYADGATDIGAWGAGVPSAHEAVFSVLQNQQLLVDHGAVAANTAGCVITCWGETVERRTAVARSGLGITSSGQLVWAAGEQLLPGELGSALVGAGAVRAIELDINPDWVAGYLYIHHSGGPFPLPVVPGQLGIAGELVEPYSRDFLTILAK